MSAVTLVLVAVGLSSAPSTGPTAPAAPGGVVWTALHYEARKLLLSASAVMRSEVFPAAAVAPRMQEPPGSTGVPLPPWVVRISVETDLPTDRDEQVHVWVDPLTFAALQTEKRTFGKRPYEKVFRYCPGGYFAWRRAPGNPRELPLPPASWTDLQQGWAGDRGESAGGVVVTDPYALLYAVSAAQLHRPGGSLSARVVSRGRLVELAFTDGGLTRRPVDYTERWPGGVRRRRADALVRLVQVSAAALPPGQGEGALDIGFFGMQDNLIIALDADTGLPVELSGRTRALGAMVVRLREAQLLSPWP